MQIEITINNWEKYNPKRDQNTYSWLRLTNDIGYDSKLFGLSPEQKYAWILILCEASRQNKPSIALRLDHLSHISGVHCDALRQMIDHLVTYGVISAPVHCGASDTQIDQNDNTMSKCDRAVSQPSTSTTPTNERTNERKIARLDIERAYSNYPRKEGKARGMKIAQREVKTPEDLANLHHAVERYKAHVRGSEVQFMKHFATFMGEWRDWLDPHHGRAPPRDRSNEACV